VLPSELPAAGRLQLSRLNQVEDTVNGAALWFLGTQDPDYVQIKFEFEDLRIEGSLYYESKHPEVSAKGLENPGMQIATTTWISSLRNSHMADREFNSRLVGYMAHMIAYWASKNLSYEIYLWSDFDAVRARLGSVPFDMPPDSELLLISAAWYK
jgi:hypothetical protein